MIQCHPNCGIEVKGYVRDVPTITCKRYHAVPLNPEGSTHFEFRCACGVSIDGDFVEPREGAYYVLSGSMPVAIGASPRDAMAIVGEQDEALTVHELPPGGWPKTEFDFSEFHCTEYEPEPKPMGYVRQKDGNIKWDNGEIPPPRNTDIPPEAIKNCRMQDPQAAEKTLASAALRKTAVPPQADEKAQQAD